MKDPFLHLRHLILEDDNRLPRCLCNILFLNHKLVGARHIETFQSSNTTLARFSDPRRCPSYSLPYQFPSKCDSDSQMRWWGGRKGYNLGDGHFQHIYRKKKKFIKISTLLKGDDSDADALRYMSIFFSKRASPHM